MTDNRIVAVGLLTARDLEVLGGRFKRHFPVDHDDVFADLLHQLDQVKVEPLSNGVALTARRGG